MAKISLDEKAKLCVVTQIGPDEFEVLSLSSGETYTVSVHSGGAFGTCSCKWGQVHGQQSTEFGCSHLRAVWQYLLGHPRGEDPREACGQEVDEFGSEEIPF